jgi:hypothetical protein
MFASFRLAFSTETSVFGFPLLAAVFTVISSIHLLVTGNITHDFRAFYVLRTGLARLAKPEKNKDRAEGDIMILTRRHHGDREIGQDEAVLAVHVFFLEVFERF